MFALSAKRKLVSHKLANFAGQHSTHAMQIKLEELGLMAMSPTYNAHLF